ncbi:unnamed protein product [Brassicogethes aeneus]|uniref:Secreted protein n=1 Tax=Brassicogethes aeneus TaxID=1431903 RepID=A0A9P0ASW1_BRAAE|nr:unnamed protein product [Brassicogethes aeneus]
MGIFNQMIFVNLVFALFLLKLATCRPGVPFEWPNNNGDEDRCIQDDVEVIEICQRCAKQTKSPIVYPMCCKNEEDALNWCNSYINYGKPSNQPYS